MLGQEVRHVGTHYDTLGVSKAADNAEIRRAYLKKARALHPDQFMDRPAAEQARAERLMKDVNVAWSTLGNPTKRKVYDADLRQAAERVAARAGGPGRAAGTPRPTGPVGGPSRTNGVRPTPRPEPRVATPEEMELGGFGRLIQVGPLAIILLLFVGILVVTALVSSGDSDPDSPQTVVPLPDTEFEPLGCIDLVPQPSPVPCGNHQAVVWAEVGAGEQCPTDIEEALRVQLDPIYRTGQGGLYCVTRVR